MSSFERQRGIRPLAAVAMLMVGAALAGCQVRPLYADPSIGEAGRPTDELAAIEVDLADDRVGQVFRNELLFLFRSGAPEAPAKYNLRYLVSRSSDPLAVQREEDQPGSILLTVNATFILSDLEKQGTVLTGTTFASASYDFSSQRFANVRAERNAEDRAAEALAANVNTRIAAYFAAREKP